MSEFILHHYAISPFAAKIRAMLGYAELPWASALTGPMPPRPLVNALAGGYRRVPVAQLGADMFCDTRVVSEEIAQRAGRPELSSQGLSAEQRDFVNRAEMPVFFSLVRQSMGWPMARKVLADIGPLGLYRLLKDRKGVAANMAPASRPPQDAAGTIASYLDELEALLSGDYLQGVQPGMIDFSAWHALWFATEIGGKKLLQHHPATAAWVQRINAFHHDASRDIDDSECLALARNSEPRPLPQDSGDDPLLDQAVSIAPSDYAQEAVNGVLVASLPDRFILRRETPTTGVVHVHFPRERFTVQAAG